MNGADLLACTAAAAGVDVVFANPGTTESHLVAAFDAVPEIRQVLCLFEGVCTGAADGFARVAQRPALTLLHLGPGLANGLANLHNAHRARSPVVNVIGEHARGHIAADSPLTSDIQGLAGAMSHWVRTNGAPEEISWDTASAIQAARRGGVATLVVPTDCQWSSAPSDIVTLEQPVQGFYVARVDEAARALSRDTSTTALLVGGRLEAHILVTAERIARHTGCRLLAVRSPPLQAMGRDVPVPERLEHFPERLVHQLAGINTVVLAGADPPVAFFATPDASGHPLGPQGTTVTLAEPGENVADALHALAEAVDAPTRVPEVRPPVEAVDGPLTPQALASAVATTQPARAIVVDEAITTGFVYRTLHDRCEGHDWIPLTGGAIGQGLPSATGAAVAAPDRPVIALVGDGSAMYTVQALWTQARLGLNVTTVICSNRRYSILFEEYRRAGLGEPTAGVAETLELTNPKLGWPELAGSLGVPGVAVGTAEDLRAALDCALTEDGPHLIEAEIVV
jgi:acetolactate synthase-1/2/3 large subunit